jgi:hypothetical protein
VKIQPQRVVTPGKQTNLSSLNGKRDVLFFFKLTNQGTAQNITARTVDRFVGLYDETVTDLLVQTFRESQPLKDHCDVVAARDLHGT